MSEVRRWAHTVTWEGLQISAAYMAIDHGGKYVMHADYVALAAENARLRAELEQSRDLIVEMSTHCNAAALVADWLERNQ